MERGSGEHNLSPHIYAQATIVTAIVSFFYFLHYGGLEEYFHLPLFGIAGLWAACNFYYQLQGRGGYQIDRRSGLVLLLRRASVRYLVWMVVFIAAIYVNRLHPYYSTIQANLTFLERFFQIYLWAGMPYFMITLKLKASAREDYYDTAIRLLVMARQLFIFALVRQQGTLVRRALRNRYNRKVLLNLLMRFYFVAVMVPQVTMNYYNAQRMMQPQAGELNLLALLYLLSFFLWLMDTLAATTVYGIESRWLENRSRSIDLTAGGWLVCLCCYAPINSVTGTMFLFGPGIEGAAPQTFLFEQGTLLYIYKIVEVSLLAALVYSDLSLGPSLANITFKKVQDRGPYGVVRHPATVCKLSMWWVQSMAYGGFWSLPYLFGQLGWSMIYILRAYTEERHLSKFPEYRAYMARVKYRFIPGVI